jgi:hypothetical protein
MSDITNVFAIATGAVPRALSRFYITEWSKAKFGNAIADINGIQIGVLLARASAKPQNT